MEDADSNSAERKEDATPDKPSGLIVDDPANAAADLTADLTEDQALALLNRPDVTSAALALLGRNPSALKSRKVLLALTMHPRTPRHIIMPLLRRLFTFDLMQVALMPTVAADVKRAAEEQILNRLETISIGERISLARRASGRVASALLFDAEGRVSSTALDNSHLVEAAVVTALMKRNAPESLFAQVSGHPKWSLRTDVQIALLRSENLPLERALELARNFPVEFLREIVPESRREELLLRLDPGDGAEGGSGQ